LPKKQGGKMTERYNARSRKCGSCRYWQGERKIIELGNRVEILNEKGTCIRKIMQKLDKNSGSCCDKYEPYERLNEF